MPLGNNSASGEFQRAKSKQTQFAYRMRKQMDQDISQQDNLIDEVELGLKVQKILEENQKMQRKS